MNCAAPRCMRGTAVLLACVLGWATWGLARVDAQRSTRRLSGADRGQLQNLSKLVDSVVKGQRSAPSDVGLFWTNHFLRVSNNLVYVPYALSMDGEFQSGPVALYIRAVRRGAATGAFDQSAMTMASWRNLTERPAQVTGDLKDLRAHSPKDPFAFEDVVVFEGLGAERVGRALWVPPGDYDVYVAMQDRGRTAKTAVIARHLSVPDFSTGFSISSVILADRLEPEDETDPSDPGPGNAFTVAGLRVAPLDGTVLPSSRTLDVVFCIYNESLGADGKPEVEVDYGFYRKLGPTEVFFNRTLPKEFTAETVPPDFDLSAGHQILAVQSVSLATFPEGDYRLAIRVFDNVSASLILRDVHFTVASP
jgi:hypothetical protein